MASATSTIIDNRGVAVAIDSLPKTYTNNGPSGSVDTITATDPVSKDRWVQTLTYSGNQIIGQSLWVHQ